MLIIKIKESENLEKSLKRFKRKVNETKLIQRLRERGEFTKPSVKNRAMKKKAIYRQSLEIKNQYN